MDLTMVFRGAKETDCFFLGGGGQVTRFSYTCAPMQKKKKQ